MNSWEVEVGGETKSFGSLDQQPIVRVSDKELAAALGILADYHRSLPFFAADLPSAKLLTHLGTSGLLESWNYTHWNEHLGENVPNLDVPRLPSRGLRTCVMCNPPLAQERRLAWRRYEIPPHPKPYEGQDGVQFTVVTPEHREQAWLSESEIADMIALTRAAQSDRPLVAFFNGTVSNSQDHWHWQIMRAELPLQAALRARRSELRCVFSGEGIEVASYRLGPLSGLFLEGRDSAVARSLAKLVAFHDSRAGNPGLWNMLIFPPAGLLTSAVFVPRHRGTTTVELGERGTLWMAAPGVAGRLLSYVPEVAPWLDAVADEAVRAAIDDPHGRSLSRLFPSKNELSKVTVA